MKKKLLVFFFGTYLNVLAVFSLRNAGEKGFLLFCRPRRREVKPHHMEFLGTAEKFTFDYEGKKVQIYRWGTGKRRLLLCHGWESHSYWWRNVVNELPKKDFTIYSVDAPGHGLSEGNYTNVPHYSGLIEKMAIHFGGVFAILGHSLGALSSVYTMYRVPNLPVEKLVVMAAPGEVKQFFDYYQKLLGLSPRSIKAISQAFIERLGHGPEYFSLQKFASTLKLPGLIIHDKDDHDAPYIYALAAHENWKNSQMISTTGLGHNLKSLELIEKVKEFLG
jgi:pimeloyl-ACP methyl ester carboxylesterase